MAHLFTVQIGRFFGLIKRITGVIVWLLLTGCSINPVYAQSAWRATADSSTAYFAKGNVEKAYVIDLRAAMMAKPISEAEPIWTDVLRVSRQLADSVMVSTLLKAGNYYFNQNEIDKARHHVDTAIKESKRLNLPQYYLQGYVLSAKIEIRNKAYTKASLQYRRLLSDSISRQYPNYKIEALLGLTDTYLVASQLDSAMSTAQMALFVLQQLPDFKTNRYYPITLVQLSKCAYIAGDLTTAIQEIEESYTVAKVIMPDDPYLIVIGNMYTNVISDINDEKALEATQTARRVLMRQPNYGQHPYYLRLLGNEIGMLQTLDRNEEAVLLADSVFQRHSLDAVSQLNGFDSFLDRVTKTYITARKDADLARITHKATALLTIDGYGGANPGYLHGILGRYHQYKHNFAEAVQQYKEELRLDSLGAGATYLNQSLKNRIAICQAEAGQRTDAYTSFSQLVEDFDHNIHYNLWLMSDAERDNFLSTSVITNLHRSLLRYPNPQPAELGLVYNYKLLHQGVLLKTTRAINQLMHIQRQTDSSQNTIRELVSIRARLADRHSDIKPAEQRQLRQTADSLERVMGSNAVLLNQTLKTVHWQDIQASLKPGEAAIEIIRYYNFSRNGSPADSTQYAALLLRPEWAAPKRVHLPVPSDENDIEKSANSKTDSFSKNTEAYIKALYSAKKTKRIL